jgi:nicotinate-nucleotide adenylyltransferase
MALRELGLFGGSFDPVHVGHLLTARDAFERLKLDALWFIPCAASADGKALAPAALRLRWLKLAVKGQPGFKVWDGEIERGGVSRSIDTLRALRAQLGPGPRFSLLIGQDQLAQLHRWKEAEQIPKLARVMVLGRPGPRAKIRFKGAWRQISTRQIEVSSTEIRSRIAAGLGVSGMLPAGLARNSGLLRCYR